MAITRRSFLQIGTAGVVHALGRHVGVAQSARAAFKVGVTDWNLKQRGNIESFALAKRIGFDGVQVSLGYATDGRLPLADPALQQAFLAESKRVGLPIASTHIEMLHRNYLKSDPLGQKWVADAIPITRSLGVKAILLPFFGKGALTTAVEMDYVGDALRELAPEAEKAGVILGLEDTISARDNVRIIERARSRAVQVYYDVGNSTANGFDIVEEIRWLGRERICEMHLKDNPHFLGEGRIQFRPIVDAMADIGFSEWAELETDAPTGSIEQDLGRNLRFVRGLIAERNARS
jgi:sugar phosphate isomerase/epimerase